MKRKIHKLSVKSVQSKKVRGYYGDGGGLYLQVSQAGTKSWIFRYTLNGKPRDMGLGPVLGVSLAEARVKAADCRKLLLDKRDPIEVRDAARMKVKQKAKRGVPFADRAEAYIKAMSPEWSSEKHAQQWESSLSTYAMPVIGHLPVSEIRVDHILEILRPIWSDRTETASRIRQRIESILSYARADLQGPNPAVWRGNLEYDLANPSKVKTIAHHPAMPYDEISAFLSETRLQEGVAARALEFTILTACRTNEVLGSKPSEFDLDKGTWIIPAERMKTKKAHVVPLSRRALQIVQGQPKGEYVFPGRRGQLSCTAMLMLLRRRGYTCTVHGFRSAFRDWSAEQTDAPNDVCEMALAHASGDRVKDSYMRTILYEKRRKLMEQWAKFITYPVRKAA